MASLCVGMMWTGYDTSIFASVEAIRAILSKVLLNQRPPLSARLAAKRKVFRSALVMCLDSEADTKYAPASSPRLKVVHRSVPNKPIISTLDGTDTSRNFTVLSESHILTARATVEGFAAKLLSANTVTSACPGVHIIVRLPLC